MLRRRRVLSTREQVAILREKCNTIHDHYSDEAPVHVLNVLYLITTILEDLTERDDA